MTGGMSAEKFCRVLNDMALMSPSARAVAVCGTPSRTDISPTSEPGSSSNLGAAALNFDTAFHKHIYAAGVLALFQYDGSACHVFQGNGTGVVEDGAHQPVFTFPGKLRPEMSFACRLSSNPSAER
jgi:hypothetical protein